MADPAFSFKGLNVPQAPTELSLLPSLDKKKSGLRSGKNYSYLFSFKEDGLERAENNEYSVSKANASIYLPGCFVYNCCFPCLSRWLGPCWGDSFCCSWATLLEVEQRRDRWLWILNGVCFIFHTILAVLSFSLGHGKPMEVSIFRVKPEWNNTGRNGYAYTVVEDFQIRIDVVTGMFFALSAIFHGLWVFLGLWEWANYFLWRNIDRCLCFLRWVEYSLSASLMLTAIGMISGLREGFAMLSVFMLCHITMLCGLMTEMLSRPSPISYDGDGKPIYKWVGDPDPVPWDQFNFQRFYDKLTSFCWRMAPHFIGYFPYVTAWFITLSSFFRQIWDLPQDLRDRIPWFVAPAIGGTCIIFSLFALVQLRYQWVSPIYYWRTEVWYCILSLTAKAYLGLLLLWNVILAASFDEAVSFTNSSSVL